MALMFEMDLLNDFAYMIDSLKVPKVGASLINYINMWIAVVLGE